jgi:hypothetical protein
MTDESTGAAKFASKRNWERALYLATKGHRLGAMICCAFGWRRNDIPRFEGKAMISSDGMVLCNFVTSNGQRHTGAFAGTMADVIRNVRGVADHCRLDAEERAQFFKTMREWFQDDYRPLSSGPVSRFDWFEEK